MDSLGLFKWPAVPDAALVVTTTAVATAAVFVFAKATLWPRLPKVLDNPLKNVIPRTPPEKLAKLVYQPDQFPGARDVDTPVSAYLEWT